MIKTLLSSSWLEARRFASAFTSRTSSTLLSFLVLIAVSHSLTSEGYGLYVFLFSIGSALGLIAVLGQQILVVKYYQSAMPTGEPSNRALIRLNFQWLAAGCTAMLLAAFVLWCLASRLIPPYNHLWIAFLFAAIFAVSEYLQNYYRIDGRINLSLVPREIIWRLVSAICVYFLAYTGILQGGAGAMTIVTILLGMTTAYQLYYFLRSEGLSWIDAPPEPLKAGLIKWNVESLYFIANNCLNAASSYLETIIIGAMLGLDQAGFYFLALRIAMLLTLPVAAIDTVGIPMIAARFQISDRAGSQKLIGKLSFASFCISLLGGIVLAVISPFILTLFNVDFVQHTNVLWVLCVLAMSQAFFGPGSWLLMIGGGERFFLLARSILFIIYLIVLFLLGHFYGLIGVAIAGLLFNVASNVAAADWIRRKWGIDNMATAFFKPFLMCCGPVSRSLHDSEDLRLRIH